MNRPISLQIQPIGLDLGASSIRMLQLEVRPQPQLPTPPAAIEIARSPQSSNPQLSAIAAASATLPNVQQPNEDQHQPSWIAAVQRMLLEHPFVGTSVVVAIPPSMLHVRTVRLARRPQLDPDGAPQLDSIQLTELAAQFPFSLTDAVVQCLYAGPVRQAGAVSHELIVMAAQSAEIERFVRQLDSAGVALASLDCQPNALFRSIERFGRRSDDARDAQLLVDIGPRQTQVVIGRGRTLHFWRSIDVGATHLLQAIATKLGITLPEAQALRQRLLEESQSLDTIAEPVTGALDRPAHAVTRTLGRQDRVGQAVSDATRRLAEELGVELAKCLRYHAVSFRGRPPSRVRLAGTDADDIQLVAALASVLPLPVEVARPLRNIDTTRATPADLTGATAQWALATGLALRFAHGYFAAADGPPRTTAKPQPTPAENAAAAAPTPLQLPTFPEAAVA